MFTIKIRENNISFPDSLRLTKRIGIKARIWSYISVHAQQYKIIHNIKLELKKEVRVFLNYSNSDYQMVI